MYYWAIQFPFFTAVGPFCTHTIFSLFSFLKYERKKKEKKAGLWDHCAAYVCPSDRLPLPLNIESVVQFSQNLIQILHS
jgi:hypothetical protein